MNNLQGSPDMSLNNSWMKNIPSDWSVSSIEQKLINIRELEEAFQVEEVDYDWSVKEIYSNLESQMKHLDTEETDVKTENYNILNHYEEKLRPEIKNLRQKEINLITSFKTLTDKISQLKEEETTLTADQKLANEAYQKALRLYSTYFDMNIDIENSSGGLIVAIINFGFSKDMKSIKVVVDKNNRKIIDTSYTDSSNETSHKNVFGPELLSSLRESILKNVT